MSALNEGSSRSQKDRAADALHTAGGHHAELLNAKACPMKHFQARQQLPTHEQTFAHHQLQLLHLHSEGLRLRLAIPAKQHLPLENPHGTALGSQGKIQRRFPSEAIHFRLLRTLAVHSASEEPLPQLMPLDKPDPTAHLVQICSCLDDTSYTYRTLQHHGSYY